MELIPVIQQRFSAHAFLPDPVDPAASISMRPVPIALTTSERGITDLSQSVTRASLAARSAPTPPAINSASKPLAFRTSQAYVQTLTADEHATPPPSAE